MVRLDSQMEEWKRPRSMQNLFATWRKYAPIRVCLRHSYNKRDKPNAAPVTELQAERIRMGARDPYRARRESDRITPAKIREQLSSGEWIERAPYFEAVAIAGDGVFDTLKAVSKLVLKALA